MLLVGIRNISTMGAKHSRVQIDSLLVTISSPVFKVMRSTDSISMLTSGVLKIAG